MLGALVRGEDLDTTSAQWALGQVFAGDATDAQIAAFAVALRSKGETPEEMTGLAAAMLDAAHRIDVPGALVDIVGTGGDRSHSVNISTMAALLVAGAGERVVKHGNRGASSACGTADVLEELGVVLTLTPEQVAEVAVEVGITFCFAQVFHPAMRYAAAPRKEIGVPTSFNFLGPLTNPAQPVAQAIGCADLRMAPVMAQVFAERGSSALVFRGDDGLDELTVTTTSSVWRVAGGEVTAETVDPNALGISTAPADSLRGGDRAHNAAVVRALLSGEERGPIRDAVMLNAAAAFVAVDDAAGKGGPSVTPLDDALRAGLEKAASSIDSGAAANTLDRWVKATQARAS
ncbi:MAG TPA: anthranilate phosphoribosyltransferase [Actinomycetes bacterium]|nr:anthranilate phosphoribosyltransferase [Actinomycetes bacterium]